MNSKDRNNFLSWSEGWAPENQSPLGWFHLSEKTVNAAHRQELCAMQDTEQLWPKGGGGAPGWWLLTTTRPGHHAVCLLRHRSRDSYLQIDIYQNIITFESVALRKADDTSQHSVGFLTSSQGFKSEVSQTKLIWLQGWTIGILPEFPYRLARPPQSCEPVL